MILSTSENGGKRLLISSRPVHIAVSSRNSNQEVHKSSLFSLKSCIFMESWNIKRLFGSKSNFEINFDLKPSVSLFVGRKKKLRHTSFFCILFKLFSFRDRCSSHRAIMLKINWGVGPWKLRELITDTAWQPIEAPILIVILSLKINKVCSLGHKNECFSR